MYAAKKIKLRLKGLLLGLLVLIVSLGLFSYLGIINALKPVGTSETVLSFVIEEGDYLSVVSDGLIEKGLIRNALVFELYAKYQNLTNFKLGVYYLNQGMSVQDILVALNDPTAAVPKDVIITIVPGDWAKGIAQKLADQVTTVSEEELLTLWNDEDYIRSLMDEYSVLTEEIFVDGVNVLLEGYLMPETYYMNPQASADSLTRRILNQTQKVYDENKAQFEASGLSVHEVFILASVVQFEAQTDEDMRLVAQVFLNRLEINMALQSSVTVCYALYEYESWRDCENLENQQIDSRYNTYLYKGLPLGPITNPSKKSLLATLNPTDNDYLFFLADVYGDGKVYYAKTFAEHERNIEKYLR